MIDYYDRNHKCQQGRCQGVLIRLKNTNGKGAGAAGDLEMALLKAGEAGENLGPSTKIKVLIESEAYQRLKLMEFQVQQEQKGMESGSGN